MKQSFKDPRSKVLWRTGRVKLRGQDKTDLRRAVYNRASLRLSADEKRRLWRIARDRANRFMVSAPDVDFLLEIVERLGR